MKTNNTPEQLKAVENALALIHKRPFCRQSGDPKYNAQRNLSGLTHYVDDDTLRFHKGKVLTSGTLANGLLFFIGTSDAADMNNTRRGFRYVVFDLFGNTIYRPSLDEMASTSKAARKAFESQEIDVAAHYKAELANELKRQAEACANLENAIAKLNPEI